MATYISDEKIAEIRQAADIVDIVSESVILKRAGKNLSGLCPFHSEKTPSFTVNPGKQIFHCFGCGAGGDVFSFIMKRDGVPFLEAARTLARRCGISLPEKPLSTVERRRMDERDQLLEVNRRALEFFERALAGHTDGKRARDYLERRGIRTESIGNFRIGYAPKGWDNLLAFMTRKGISVQLLEKAGLVVARENRSGFYDRFRERIMFPIIDEMSRVVGFGGRVMDDATPKYLNTPETPLYSKRRTLYGLHRAKEKCRAYGSVYIVEGYLDLIALHQGGHENSVATLGTALTPEHIRLLARYAGRMVLVYDSDEAGLRSARRCVDLFWKEHVDFRRGDVFREEQADTRILVLPQGHDPDSFIREKGPDDFRRLADAAPGIVTFLLESAVARHGLSPEGKARVVSELMAPLAAVNDPVAQALYIQKLCERVGLPEAVVRRRLKEARAGGGAARPAAAAPSAATAPENKFELRIIAMMLHFPDIIPEVRERGVLNEFTNPQLKRLAEAIIERGYASVERLPVLVAGFEDEASRQVLSALAMAEESWNLKGCRLLINRFLGVRRKERSDDRLQKEIEAAEKANNENELNRLLIQKQLLAGRRGKRSVQTETDARKV